MHSRHSTVQPTDRAHFPALYRCADDASLRGQQAYLKWLKVNLALLVAGSLSASIIFSDQTWQRSALIAAAASFILATGTTILLATQRWEKLWYAGRAIAESVKSLAWKYACGADPYSAETGESNAREDFLAALEELLNEHKSLAADLASSEMMGEQITKFMSELRISSLAVRRDTYLSQRVLEQRAWYGRKAKQNRRHRNIWFWALIVLQIAGAITALLLVWYPQSRWHATGVFAALASALAAWGQVKRYQELSQSYGLAAQELGLIAERASLVDSSDQLARFVNDSETAISREHAMWVARREVR